MLSTQLAINQTVTIAGDIVKTIPKLVELCPTVWLVTRKVYAVARLNSFTRFENWTVNTGNLTFNFKVFRGFGVIRSNIFTENGGHIGQNIRNSVSLFPLHRNRVDLWTPNSCIFPWSLIDRFEFFCVLFSSVTAVNWPDRYCQTIEHNAIHYIVIIVVAVAACLLWFAQIFWRK